MTGFLARVVGGAAQGFGQGMALDIKAERDRIHAELERKWKEGESQKDRTFRTGEREAGQTFTDEQRRAGEGATSARDEKKHGYDVDLKGLENRLSNGKPTDVKRYQSERDALPEGDPRRAAYDDAIKKLTTPNEPMVEVQDPDDENNTIMVPRSRAEGMRGRGTKEQRENRQAADDGLRIDARAAAEREAKDKAGWLSTDTTDFGGSRADWIKKRTEEIYQEKKGGKPKIEALADAAKPEAKPDKTKPPPAIASAYPGAKWSDKAGAWVVQQNGKWFAVE